MDIGYIGALLGGVLTLLSPCSAMLLPAFFAYAFSTRRQLMSRTFVFYLGLISSLVPLGIFAGVLGGLLTTHRFVLVSVAAYLVIALGLVQLLGIPIPALVRSGSGGGASVLSVYVLGAVYGVAGVCAGPILGSVLTIAAVGGNAVYGAFLLALYALGMTVPLAILALLWGRLGASGRRWLRPRSVRIGRWENSLVMVISGLLSIGIGVLLLVSNGTAKLSGLLSVGNQFALESAVSNTVSVVSNTTFVIAAVVVLAAVVAIVLWRSRPRPKTAGSSDDDGTSRSSGADDDVAQPAATGPAPEDESESGLPAGSSDSGGTSR